MSRVMNTIRNHTKNKSYNKHNWIKFFYIKRTKNDHKSDGIDSRLMNKKKKNKEKKKKW